MIDASRPVGQRVKARMPTSTPGPMGSSRPGSITKDVFSVAASARVGVPGPRGSGSAFLRTPRPTSRPGAALLIGYGVATATRLSWSCRGS